MKIDVVTIFPEYLEPARLSLLGKAQAAGLVSLAVHDLRMFTFDRHRTVDDTPYGGGPGMVMLAEPWGAALASVSSGDAATRPVLVVPTPSGRPFTQTIAAELATAEHLVFACGRYEGIDARVLAHAADSFDVLELSIGDYVLAGGEVAALVIIEAVSRLIPGVLGNESSVVDDSFAPGAMEHLLEGPVFSKPALWNGHDVPSVLLSGDHGAIARWRRDESLRRTAHVRPDLIEGRPEGAVEDSDRSVLEALGWSLVEGRWQRPPLAVSD
jgi:tRNA (guanine37-N1)-methyltransferase